MSGRDQESDRLMAALSRGDDAALEGLIHRWERSIMSFVFGYLRNESLAREVTQETFVRLYQKRDLFKAGSSFSSWVFTMAANLARNKLRHLKRHGMRSLDEALLAGDGPLYGVARGGTPRSALSSKQTMEALNASLQELSHDLRTTLLLYHYENLSYKEIGRIVGCTAHGVQSRLYRARRRLRRSLLRRLEGGEGLELLPFPEGG